MKFSFPIALYFLILLFIYPQIGFGQAMQLSKNATISVLTCESGTELYSTFGHTAVRVKDDPLHLDVVFNYGTFDFNTDNFYLKFIKGDLNYFATVSSYSDFYYEYTLENRSIYEQALLLTDIQKQNLFDSLNATLSADKKYYTYKFIDKNCTTMVVDQINTILKTNAIIKKTDTDKTYREVLTPYLENHFIENLGINIIFGIKVDQLGKKLFLPNEFMQSLTTSKVNANSISMPPITVLNAIKKPQPKSLWNNSYAFASVLILLLLTRKNWVYLMLLTIFGMLGLFLLSVGFYSYHQEVLYNYNVLLFNPLLLGVVYFYIRKNFKWLYYTCITNLVLLMFYTLFLTNKPNFFTFSLLICTAGIVLYRFFKISSSKESKTSAL
jgi:hypothetical protein